MAVRSGLPDGLVFWVCHGVVRLGYPTVIYYYHGREVAFTDGLSSLVLPQHFPMLVIVRWGVPRFMMGTWYGTLLISE